MKTIDDWMGAWFRRDPDYTFRELVRAVQRDAVESAADDLLRKSAHGSKLHTGEPMTELESCFLEEEVVPWLRARSPEDA